ncbi:MAG: hypothetical protein MZW92_47230 [Comamonadaceae bacterium]|nr:hypothetical protein [Comamonadaceae bacterium]
MLQAMRHWTIERQRCGLAIVHNELTQDELERILERMEEVESIADMKPSSASLARQVWFLRQELARVFGRLQGHCAVVRGNDEHPFGLHLA